MNDEKCHKCNAKIWMWTYSKNNVFKISICSKCNTRTNHFDYHKYLCSKIINKIEDGFRKIQKFIRMKKGLCFEPRCKKTPEIYQIEDEKFLLCYDHAKDYGFCASCKEFYGGLEEFDFNNSSHFCSNCLDEFNHDCGFDDYDNDLEEYYDEFVEFDDDHSEPDFDLTTEEAGVDQHV